MGGGRLDEDKAPWLKARNGQAAAPAKHNPRDTSASVRTRRATRGVSESAGGSARSRGGPKGRRRRASKHQQCSSPHKQLDTSLAAAEAHQQRDKSLAAAEASRRPKRIIEGIAREAWQPLAATR